MKQILGWTLVSAAVALVIGCSDGGDGDGTGPSGSACEQACDKLESCGNTTCTITGNDCSGQAKEIADCINSSPCDQTQQCLFSGAGGSGGGSGSGGTGGSGGGGACDDIAGVWDVVGTCGVDDCLITQNGCSVNFVCDDGAASYSGSVTSGKVDFQGATGTCTGTVTGDQITGTCSGPLGTCAYTATR